MPADTSVPIRILAVDDHPLIRRGVTDLIADEPDLTLVGEASGGREAIELFRAVRPDVTLMDLQMPDMDGIEGNGCDSRGIRRRKDSNPYNV